MTNVQTTDIKALDEAFAGLRTEGIQAFGHFYCCGGCATSAISARHDEDIVAGRNTDTIGAVYYHEQSADRAVDGHGLTLGYGGYDAARTAEVGERVCAALRAHGLQPEWDGDPNTTIEIPRFRVSRDELPAGEGLVGDQYDEDDDGYWDDEDEDY